MRLTIILITALIFAISCRIDKKSSKCNSQDSPIREIKEDIKIESLKQVKQIEPKVKQSFVNYNDIINFYTLGDTLYCNTTNGIKYYSQERDKWIVEETARIKHINNSSKYYNYSLPEWYNLSNYTTVLDVNETCLMINHGDEAGYRIKSEIVDTVSRIAYILPSVLNTSFYNHNNSIWIGTRDGILKIDKSNNKLTTYLTYPIISELVGVHEFDNRIYYLDSVYGLFMYNKTTKEIEAINEFNSKFKNRKGISQSILLGGKLYVLAYSTDIFNSYASDLSLIIFSLESNAIKKVQTNLRFADTFLKVDEKLFFYGEYYEPTEGLSYHYGGLSVLDTKKDTLINMVSTPVFDICLNGDSLDVIAITTNEDNMIKVNSYSFDNSLRLTHQEVEKYIYPHSNNPEYQKDSILFDGEYYQNNAEKSLAYFDLMHKREKRSYQDTIMRNKAVELTDNMIELGTVQKIKY